MRIAIVWMTMGFLVCSGCDPAPHNSGSVGLVGDDAGAGGRDTGVAGQGASGTAHPPDTPAEGSAKPTSAGVCLTENATRLCTCQPGGETVYGRQNCELGAWGPCQCEEISTTVVKTRDVVLIGGEDPRNKGNSRFAWRQDVPKGGKCNAGYHEGVFDGIYNPEAIILLTLGFWASIPVMGDVRFTIEEKPGSNGETFEIADGVFEGSALMAFPFKGEFYGTLDCPSASFEGVLRNCYYIVGEDKYAFDGVARSRYDKFNFSFYDGVWSVTEPEVALIESPLVPPEELPTVDELVFPQPLEVEPGALIPLFPLGFKGGAGTWWGDLVSPP